MKISIQAAVNVIVGLLFLASFISIYFALGQEATLPLVLVATSNILAVIFLTFLITRGVIRPLHHVRRLIQFIEKGEYSVRVEPDGTKEMEEMGKAFNSMAESVEAAQAEVRRANEVLENKVHQRTQELKELADSLEQKVQERTKELQENITQLERFQRLAVGRELRMVELKDEMKDLKEQVVQKTQKTTNARTTKQRTKKDS